MTAQLIDIGANLTHSAFRDDLPQVVVRPVHQAAAALFDDFVQRADVPDDDRRLPHEGLDRDDTERLVGERRDDARQRVDVQRAELVRGSVTEEANPRIVRRLGAEG